VLKKNPLKAYEKETGRSPIVGTMAGEGRNRRTSYTRRGCNVFNSGRPVSTPLGFWTEEDIWEYLETFFVPYCNIYDKGYHRTGCIFCMFGVHRDEGKNRFELLKETHPHLWAYCMDKLGLRSVLGYMGIPIEDPIEYSMDIEALFGKGSDTPTK
jgi:3'-phosphoadenosine 5'-phosphosulfate sulfotransferase (PAPS reductase)/FAD synthetase